MQFSSMANRLLSDCKDTHNFWNGKKFIVGRELSDGMSINFITPFPFLQQSHRLTPRAFN